MKRCQALSRFECVVFAFLTVALAFAKAEAIERRQTKSDAIPSAISIPPSQYWDGNDGPWSSFPLQVGGGVVGGKQSVRVMPSTAGTAIWTIAPEGCPPNYVPDCSDSRGFIFYRNNSLTWAAGSIYETGLEDNLNMDSSGFQGYDTATLGWQGGTTVTNEHSIIWNIADSLYWIGIFGLNPRPTNFTTFSNPQTGFMQSIFDRKAIPSLSYGYTAGNQYRFDAVFGSLTLGGYDANRFEPNGISFPFYQDISRDLLVNLHSVDANNSLDLSPPSNLLPEGSVSIFIDSTIPEIWLPESACAAFEKAFGLEYNDTFERYIISSSQRDTLLAVNPAITFSVGPIDASSTHTVNITLPYRAFDLQVHFPIIMNPNTSYYFPLRRAANDTQYTLGRTFLQEAYLIADYENQNFSVSACNWDQDKIQSQKIVPIISSKFTDTNDEHHDPILTTPEIAGIGVGTVSVIAILSFALFILHRRRIQQKRRLASIATNEANEKHDSSASNRPIISAPIGGELNGDGLHEMDHSERMKAELDDQHGYAEIVGGEYFASGKYYRYSITEMEGTETPVYEMDGGDGPELATSSEPVRVSEVERRPKVPAK